MKLIRGMNIKDAYLKILEYVYNNGYEVRNERGTVQECLNIVSYIARPEGGVYPINPLSVIPKGSVWNTERLETYSEELLSPDSKGFVYTYGERLRGLGVDQINHAIDRLKSEENSRRATCVTWRPDIDCTAEDVPCLILVDFKLREGELITTAVWRSHDIFGAYFPNLIGLYKVCKYVATEIGAGVGSITVQSISAHIYEHDLNSASELLEANGR